MIKDILAFVDDDLVSENRFALPAGLARRHGARLSAVHVLADAVALGPIEAGPAAGEIIRLQLEQAEADAAVLGRRFRSLCKAFDLVGDWHTAYELHDALRLAGQHDLVVVGQSTAPHFALRGTIRPEDITLAAGRPTLFVPVKGRFDKLGDRVVIAWKPTKEATRAVHDALPLLNPNATITILEVCDEEPAKASKHSGSDLLRQHLVRHGFTTTVETIRSAELSTCDTILARATAVKADLLVMGSYGHSRLRELLLGGVTRSMLQEMDIPVLMSH